MKKLLTYFLRFCLGFLAFIIIYFLVALSLTVIPANPDAQQPDEGISIYLVSNGFHADLVLPVANEVYDWKRFLDFERFEPAGSQPTYLAFGWGDKGFFFDTPEIQDLTISTTLNAVFLPSTSVMHVVMYFGKPAGDGVIEIKVRPEQYQRLVAYIRKGFQSNGNGRVVQLAGTGYGHVVDNFYLGEGSYSLFTTCNSWINAGLKEAGLKTATWAPFDHCILYHFDQ